MSINLKQNNTYGDNNADFSKSGNDTYISKKTIIKYQTQGFIAGVIASVISGVIVYILTKFI